MRDTSSHTSKLASLAILALLTTACAGNGDPMSAQAPGSPKITPEVTMAAQTRLRGQNPGPGVRWNEAGRLQVYIYVDAVSDGNMGTLHDRGLEDLIPSPALGLVEGWVNPKDLNTLAALPFVTRIALPRYARPN